LERFFILMKEYDHDDKIFCVRFRDS
jgi:hypothetical protein